MMEKTPEPVKIAYCIQCHKYTPVLQELVDRLYGPHAKIFVHVDGKVPLDEFAPLTGLVRFVYPRVKVHWGTFSQIDCMLRLLRATQKSDCRYAVLLSGDTLPLYGGKEVHEALSAARLRGEEQIGCQPFLDIDEIRHKLCTNHYVPYRERKQKLWPVVRFAASLLRPSANRRFEKLPPVEKGSNWIAITDRFRDYALDRIDRNPDYVQAFRHSLCGDEIFFHTLLCDSPFAASNTRRSVLFADWDCDCPPRTFGSGDLPRLAALLRNPEGGGNARNGFLPANSAMIWI